MLPLLNRSIVRSVKSASSLRTFHAVALNCVDSDKLTYSKCHCRKTPKYCTSYQQNQVRPFSSESVRSSLAHLVTEYFGPDTLFVNAAMKYLTFYHEFFGLPWWATICVVTVGLKAFIVFPLSVHARKAEGRRSLMNEKMLTVLPQLEKEVQVLARSRGYSPQDAKNIFNVNRNQLVRDYYIKENCHPLKGFASVLAQLPIWLSLSFSLRHLSGSSYLYNKPDAMQYVAMDMKNEGALWFSNLLLPDQLYLLPVVLLTTNLTIAAINLYDINRLQRGMIAKAVTGILMFYSVAIFSISTLMPSCITFYWSVSAVCSLVQLLLLRNQTVQGVLKVPDMEDLMKKRIQGASQAKDTHNSAKSMKSSGNSFRTNK